jgi:EAL domain-containing protein (putative c-di-GMP-specific phosphodiesterase class I)
VSLQSILIVDDQREIGDGLALLLKVDGRRIVVCSDVESADLALRRYPFTHVVADIHFSTAFAFEGLEFVHRTRMQHPSCTIIVMTGELSESIRSAALASGANAVLGKPFDGLDLETALDLSPASSEAAEVIRVRPIAEMLGDQLQIVFQPIVGIGEGVKPFGFEALSRVEWPAGTTADLFEYAARRLRLTDLNLAAIGRAVQAAAVLPVSPVFINVDPPTFESPALIDVLDAATASSGVGMDRIVLEVTERLTFTDRDAAGRVFDALRARGIRFALDDHASAYSHLELIDRIQPSFMKISSSFGTQFENDRTKTTIIRHIVALAADLGCVTILEGIETAETAAAASALGVPLAQGYYFGRPAPAAHWTTARAVAATI